MKNLRNIVWSIIFLSLIPFTNLQAQEKPIDREKLWQEFLTFKNRDLMPRNMFRMPPIDSFPLKLRPDELFEKLFFEGNEPAVQLLHVGFISEIKSGEKTNYFVMLTPRMKVVPQKPYQTIYFFDQNRKIIAQTELRTGWGMKINGIEITKNADFDFQILKITTSRTQGFNVSENTAQYYALLNDKLVLIRLEYRIEDNRFDKPENENLNNRNVYGCEYPSFGLPVIRKTADEWKQALFSENSIDILDALMWLGGRHYSLEELEYDQQITDLARKADPDFNVNKSYIERCPNSINDAKVFAEMKADKEVQKRLSELTQSKIVWIKEAAELALTPIKNVNKTGK